MRHLLAISLPAVTARKAQAFSPSANDTLEEEIATLSLRVLDDRVRAVVGREVSVEVRDGGGHALLTPDRSGVDGLLSCSGPRGPGSGRSASA